jgi:hypothetical protein
MSLDKVIFDEISHHPEGSFNTASEVSGWVKERLAPKTAWYCRKYNTTRARKHGRSKCVTRIKTDGEWESDFHSAKANGCGQYWLVRKG